MDEKLLTLREASEYLGISQEKIVEMVDGGQIGAYKLGGLHIRFRLSQLEAARFKLNKSRKPPAVTEGDTEAYGLNDRIKDFFYFNDFYIVSSIVILFVLIVIFKSR
ncbi:MAG: hypothetical protein AUJ75_01245 [Candidatus Omnitrophica bacterium CG1_02_49_10]|nr:MAG: hypothetical protein AUJ75_01245 [Candidatus Omnitrophica bacterium CG1_02_49_10]